jgi:hypothetical protein
MRNASGDDPVGAGLARESLLAGDEGDLASMVKVSSLW